MVLFTVACENTSDQAVLVDPVLDPAGDPDSHAQPEAAAPELARVEVVERDDSVTLHAHDPEGATIGALKFTRESSADALYPAEAEGYFDVASLDEAEIDQRARDLEVTLDYPPLENRMGCALRMAQAVAVCMDKDKQEFVLTCPVGLYAVLCECGPLFGMNGPKLTDFCGG
jgi:hypothetical protein